MLVTGSSEADFAIAFQQVIDQNPPTGPAPRTYTIERWWAEGGGVVGFTTFNVEVRITGSDVPADDV